MYNEMRVKFNGGIQHFVTQQNRHISSDIIKCSGNMFWCYFSIELHNEFTLYSIEKYSHDNNIKYNHRNYFSVCHFSIFNIFVSKIFQYHANTQLMIPHFLTKLVLPELVNDVDRWHVTPTNFWTTQ